MRTISRSPSATTSAADDEEASALYVRCVVWLREPLSYIPAAAVAALIAEEASAPYVRYVVRLQLQEPYMPALICSSAIKGVIIYKS